MKNFKPILILPVAFLMILNSCGPSAAEIERMDREYKAKEAAEKKALDSLIDIKQDKIGEYVGKLKSIKEKLRREDTFYVAEEALNPPLNSGYNESNVMVIAYQSLDDSLMDTDYEDFGLSYGDDSKKIIQHYLKLKAKVPEDTYFSIYASDREDMKSKVELCDINKTPYLMVIKQDTMTKVILGDHEFRGGEILGYCWLVDVRNMEVIGRRGFYAAATDIMVTSKEADYTKISRIEQSARSSAKSVIDQWLYKFKVKK